ncbi:MAG: dihydrofolate reductase family protein [Thermoanaerobaculia bacterium]|jgi:dihydrofolate reductase
MRKVVVFDQVSLDGYFVDARGDMSWAHKDDDEWNAFVEGNAAGGGGLAFGRVTYEMMASFWPTEQAKTHFPIVAERMNSLPKIVFTRTLRHAAWNGTKVLEGDAVAHVKRLKGEDGDDLVILGSGTLVSHLAGAGLIDEYQIVVNPLVLGSGRTLFEGVAAPIPLRCISTQHFRNGNVFLRYVPAT